MSKDRFDDHFEDYKAKKHAEKTKKLNLNKPVDELPTWDTVKGESNNNTCIICKNRFRDNDIVENCILCSRYFHYKELRSWVNTAGTCPSCKNEI
ncbi:MAG: RING finger domain-containing protein [Candidatus Heimdallarchaeota archaeon]